MTQDLSPVVYDDENPPPPPPSCAVSTAPSSIVVDAADVDTSSMERELVEIVQFEAARIFGSSLDSVHLYFVYRDESDRIADAHCSSAESESACGSGAERESEEYDEEDDARMEEYLSERLREYESEYDEDDEYDDAAIDSIQRLRRSMDEIEPYVLCEQCVQDSNAPPHPLLTRMHAADMTATVRMSCTRCGRLTSLNLVY